MPTGLRVCPGCVGCVGCVLCVERTVSVVRVVVSSLQVMSSIVFISPFARALGSSSIVISISGLLPVVSLQLLLLPPPPPTLLPSLILLLLPLEEIFLALSILIRGTCFIFAGTAGIFPIKRMFRNILSTVLKRGTNRK